MKSGLLAFAFLFLTISGYAQALIDPKIYTYKSNENIPVVIVMRAKADISQVKNIKGKEAKGNFVFETLYNNSKSSQKNLLTFFDHKKITYRSFYIVNMVATHVNQAMINELAQMPEIESILEDGKFVGAELMRDEDNENERALEWGITKIKADSVWLQFTTGTNVIIGGQDTGYDWDHPALINKYKGWDGVTADHNFHWHDAIHNSSGNPCGNDSAIPCDDNNHGTHTMGTMVGDDGAGNQIGVAPGARWIGCRNMDENNGTLTTYVECFEWFLAPYPIGGNTSQGNPSKAPHVINNSWGCPTSEGCNTTNFAIMEAALNALRDAGTVVVVSAGNAGSACSTVNDPAAIFNESFSVGATNSGDVIAGFSSRGLVTVDGSNRLKPNVSAPGVAVRSCIIGTGYASFNGTSMAGPHVAGAVALIIAANPNLAGEVDAIENILEQTAVPLTSGQTCGGVSGSEIPNTTYGFGRIDALKAVKRAKDSLYVPLIKVDQFGYLPLANKIALLSDPVIGYNSAGSYTPSSIIKVKNAISHNVVFSGSPVAWKGGTVHDQSGDKVWWFDFTSLITPGTYYISDGNTRSEDFTIHNDVYKELFTTTFNNFYHQRCGCPKLSTHVGEGHDDVTCHSQDNNCRFINDPNNASLYKNMSGGWHDAGDYNKYVNFAYNAVIPLLSSFEYNAQAYNDDLNVVESGNGIPDILDEVKYELDWLLKMQAGDGGVHCVVGVQNFASASPPSADAATRLYGPKTTSATFSTAAMLAFGAVEFRKVNNVNAQSYANTLQTAAINAWNWGNANPSVTYNNAGIVAAGEQEVDAYERSMRKLSAAIYLYALTKDNTYKTYVESNYTAAHLLQWNFVYPFEANTQLNLLFYTNLQGINNGVGTTIKNTYRNSVMNSSDNFPAVSNKTDAYRSYLINGNHVWGSNAIKTNMGNIFQSMNHFGLEVAKKDSFITTYGDYLHYIHGNNPTALCYLTNMKNHGAENSVNTVYHGWFSDGSALWDDVRTSTYGPPPGILTGGVNPSWNLDGCCPGSCGGSNPLCINMSPPDNQPILKSYKDWNTGWPQNSWEITENSIAYQASYLFLLSAFVNNATDYSVSPVVSNIENANMSISTNGKGIVLRSPDQTWYRIKVNNSGVIATEVVPSISGANTKLSNNTLNFKQVNTGIIIKSPDNVLWKLSVDNGGNLTSTSLGSLPVPNTRMESGDVIIESNQQGILLKDNDSRCYYMSVDNAGKLFLRAVECE